MSRSRLLGLAAAFFVFLFVEILWIHAFSFGHHQTGDTNVLLAGAQASLDCVHLGIWRFCPNVAPYPLLQYVPASILLRLGGSETAALIFLARISVVAFAGCLGLSWYFFRSRPKIAALAVLSILSSAATYQATSAFGEMLAAFVILAALVSIRTRRPILIFICFALASISKETIPPFIAMLGLIIGWLDAGKRIPPRRIWLPLALGVSLGTLANLLFNQFRFGSFRNLPYLDPGLRTPTWKLKGEYFLAEWFSPVSGLLWFWTIAVLILFAAAFYGLRSFFHDRRSFHLWLPPLLVVGLALAFTFGLANWYSPFGWIAYGHRLAVPLFPALVITALWTIGDQIESALSRLKGKPVLATFFLMTTVFLSLPQITAPWNWLEGWRAVTVSASNQQCNDTVSIQADQTFFYHCVTDALWVDNVNVIKAVVQGGHEPFAGKLLGGSAILLLSLFIFVPSKDLPKKTSRTEDTTT